MNGVKTSQTGRTYQLVARFIACTTMTALALVTSATLAESMVRDTPASLSNDQEHHGMDRADAIAMLAQVSLSSPESTTVRNVYRADMIAAFRALEKSTLHSLDRADTLVAFRER